jgi:hypothetical protein
VHSGAPASAIEEVDGENDSAPDLDASIEDLDVEEEVEEGEEMDSTQEYEEEPSLTDN